MNDSRLPTWLLVLLTLVGLVVLGPPLLGLIAGLVGLTVGLAVIALKLGALAFGVFLVVAVLRAVFGQRAPAPRLRPVEPLEELTREADARKAAELAALDAELARALNKTP